jgi:hypothetical protein
MTQFSINGIAALRSGEVRFLVIPVMFSLCGELLASILVWHINKYVRFILFCQY